MAHKKGLGSSKNGRDSNAQRLGVKAFSAASLSPADRSWSGSAARATSRARMSVSARTTRCLRGSPAIVKFRDRGRMGKFISIQAASRAGVTAV